IGADPDAGTADAGEDLLEVAGRPLEGVQGARVGVEGDVGNVGAVDRRIGHARPGPAGIVAAVDTAARAAHRGVDDRLPGRRRLRIDEDLERRLPEEVVVSARLPHRGAAGAIERELYAVAVEVHQAVEYLPGPSSVHAAQEADAGRARVALARGRED